MKEKYLSMFLDEECVEAVIKTLDKKVEDYIKAGRRQEAINLLNTLIVLEEHLATQDEEVVSE